VAGEREERERGVGEGDHGAAEDGGEGEAVARVEDEAEEGGDVADLGGVVEGAPGDDVGDVEAGEGELDERDGAAAAREDRDIAVAH
jgi:hypothetical protein